MMEEERPEGDDFALRGQHKLHVGRALPGIAKNSIKTGGVFGVLGAAMSATASNMAAMYEMGTAITKGAFNAGTGFFRSYQKFFTDSQVRDWVHKDAKERLLPDGSVKDDGTSPGGRYYVYVKNYSQGLVDTMMPMVRRGVLDQLKGNRHLQDMLRGKDVIKHFNEIDQKIADIYQECYPEIAKKLRPHGTLRDPQYNHRFLTETSWGGDKEQGDIVSVDADRIVDMFKRTPGNGTHFPKIILTSSHAQGEKEADVRSITEGIEALARDSEGQPLNHGFIDKGVKPGQTLTLYACDVGKTPWKNGAKLLQRILDLKEIAKKALPGGGNDTEFHDVSPGLKRIAKLMLKCMVEDPRSIDVNAEKGMGVINANADRPIVLRSDAVHVAHHFQLIGYSKGGNVVSDAMRYLVAELTAKRADGRSVFITHEKRGKRDATMEVGDVNNIVRSVACLALASVEVGMSDFDKRHGVRRVAINNEHDLISAHKNYEGTLHDERWIIKGTEQYQGHAPQHMMGARNPSKLFDEIVGYAHDDPRVARRLKEFFAGNYGKAAISALRFNGEAKKGEVLLEAATGTTDAELVQRAHVIRTAFKNAGLMVTRFGEAEGKPGFIAVQCRGADFVNDHEALDRLKDAFTALRNDKTNGLVIAQTIMQGGEGHRSDIERQKQLGPQMGAEPASRGSGTKRFYR